MHTSVTGLTQADQNACCHGQVIGVHAGDPLRSVTRGAAAIRTWPQRMARTVWRTENQWSARSTCALQYRDAPRLPAIRLQARHEAVSQLIASAMQGSYCGGLHEPRLHRGWEGLQGRHTKSQHHLCDMRSVELICRNSSSVSVSDIHPHRDVTSAHLQQVRDDSHLQSQAVALSLCLAQAPS
jgi:hypothetical protein